MKVQGRKLGKCIKFKDKWVTPAEFESMSAVQARKWRQTVKFDGKPIGEWLLMNEMHLESLASQKESESNHSSANDNNETSLQQANSVNSTNGQHHHQHQH